MDNNLKKKEKDTNRPLITFLLVVLIFGMFGISYFIYEMAYVNQEEENNNQQ